MALFTFVIVVVLTPREQMWAFALYAALIFGVVLIAGLSPLLVLKRMAVEIRSSSLQCCFPSSRRVRPPKSPG